MSLLNKNASTCSKMACFLFFLLSGIFNKKWQKLRVEMSQTFDLEKRQKKLDFQ
jgi:hypothetical protein